MEPLKVTAHLATPIALADDWTPSLESLLTFLLVDGLGINCPNPTPVEVEANQPVIDAHMPLAKGEISGQWYWQASSPHYRYSDTINDCFHKRWDCQDQHLDWKGKKAKWSDSEGNTKSWTVPMRLRNPHQINWFCVGDRVGLQRLLSSCYVLGRKSKGQVWKWDVVPIERDLHLWGANGQLMRPIPQSAAAIDPPFRLLRWGWRPPTFLPQNATLCWMPVGNAVKEAG